MQVMFIKFYGFMDKQIDRNNLNNIEMVKSI